MLAISFLNFWFYSAQPLVCDDMVASRRLLDLALIVLAELATTVLVIEQFRSGPSAQGARESPPALPACPTCATHIEETGPTPPRARTYAHLKLLLSIRPYDC